MNICRIDDRVVDTCFSKQREKVFNQGFERKRFVERRKQIVWFIIFLMKTSICSLEWRMVNMNRAPIECLIWIPFWLFEPRRFISEDYECKSNNFSRWI